MPLSLRSTAGQWCSFLPPAAKPPSIEPQPVDQTMEEGAGVGEEGSGGSGTHDEDATAGAGRGRGREAVAATRHAEEHCVPVDVGVG